MPVRELDFYVRRNPLASAGAKATFECLLEHDLQGNAAKMGVTPLDRLHVLGERYGMLGDVRGKGLMIGHELIEGDSNPSPAAAASVLEHSKAGGLLAGKGGLHNNVIRLAPPMAVTDLEVQEALEVLDAAIARADEERAR